MNNENKEDILEVEEGVHIQQTKDADKSNEISFEETNEEGSMSEERRKDEKLASQGSQKPNDDEISFEVVNEDGETDIRITIKKLREKIKKLEQEKQEYLDLSQRTRADYVNYKREVDANRVSDRKFATKRFIEELLPVLDSYDMAQSNKESWEKVDQNWRMGIEYIFGQLRSVLEKEGVVQFGKVGDIFDPLLHETMQSVEVESGNDNDKIIKVLQNGYKMHDSILRPARIHVGVIKK